MFDFILMSLCSDWIWMTKEWTLRLSFCSWSQMEILLRNKISFYSSTAQSRQVTLLHFLAAPNMSQKTGGNKTALILSENYSILFSFNPKAVWHYKDQIPLKNLHNTGIFMEFSNKTVSNQSVFWKTADLGF